MKIYAQHGYGPGDKITRGIGLGCIQGIVFSPRDMDYGACVRAIEDARTATSGLDLLIDPQYYAGFGVRDAGARFGHLEACREYAPFFRRRRRSRLESDSRAVRKDIRACLDLQKDLGLTWVVAPNVVIEDSFDSIQAAIAKSFIRNAGRAHAKGGYDEPLLATLAVSVSALQNDEELCSFVDDLTAMDPCPSGYYLLVWSPTGDRHEWLLSRVISGWLYLNYALQLNGYRVINGYGDLMAPFLAAAGGYATGTGWFENLRSFSFGRYRPATGGRQPRSRYVSNRLLNRILALEVDMLRDDVSEVLNGLDTDDYYESGTPDRTEEALQTWDALREISNELATGDVAESLARCQNAIEDARHIYEEIADAETPLEPPSRDGHLEALEEGLEHFRSLGELPAADDTP